MACEMSVYCSRECKFSLCRYNKRHIRLAYLPHQYEDLYGSLMCCRLRPEPRKGREAQLKEGNHEQTDDHRQLDP